jgi:hypothetical protein
MSSGLLYRLSGIALLLGSLLFIIGITARIILFYPGLDSNFAQAKSPLWIPVDLVIFSGFLLLAVGLPGLYAHQSAHIGSLGLISFIFIFLGVVLFSGLYMLDFTIFPWLAVTAPKLAATEFPLPGLTILYEIAARVLVGGFLVLGSVARRIRMLPHWTVWLFIAPVLGLVLLLPLPEIMSEALDIASNVSPALGLAWMGYILWSAKGEVSR